MLHLSSPVLLALCFCPWAPCAARDASGSPAHRGAPRGRCLGGSDRAELSSEGIDPSRSLSALRPHRCRLCSGAARRSRSAATPRGRVRAASIHVCFKIQFCVSLSLHGAGRLRRSGHQHQSAAVRRALEETLREAVGQVVQEVSHSR